MQRTRFLREERPAISALFLCRLKKLLVQVNWTLGAVLKWIIITIQEYHETRYWHWCHRLKLKLNNKQQLNTYIQLLQSVFSLLIVLIYYNNWYYSNITQTHKSNVSVNRICVICLRSFISFVDCFHKWSVRRGIVRGSGRGGSPHPR